MLVPSAKIFYRITLGHKIIWVINSGIQNFYLFDILVTFLAIKNILKMGKKHYPPEACKLIRKMINSKPSCPNKTCLRTFRNAKGVACHFNKSILCQQAMKILSFVNKLRIP